MTDEDFEPLLVEADTKPFLVLFNAPKWCSPGARMKEIVAAMGKEFGDKLVLAEYDVDSQQFVRDRYEVQGIPTLILFKKGEVVERVNGPTSKDRLRQRIEKHVGA